mmetsp:Transcript_14231/g.30658  ORF Transcript_14231/g.30658 Transcript_14231/m.30658 type:complete len:121 (+) Transcript_14231:66-428(+)
MANAPDRFEAVYLPDGVKKVEYIPDPHTANAATFKIEREDHTIGNLLRMQLLEDKDVVFAGYRQPHPLQHHIIVRIQTKSSPTGQGVTTVAALRSTIDNLISEMSLITERLEGCLEVRKR